MLHHRNGCFVKIIDNPQSVASILEICSRRSVLTPLDPFHVSYAASCSMRLVESRLLVRVGTVPQTAKLSVDCPLDLRIFYCTSAEGEGQFSRELLDLSCPVYFPY